MDNHLDCSMNDDAIYKDIEEKKRRRSGDGPRRSFGRVPTSRSRANNMNDGRKPSGSFLDEISLRAQVINIWSSSRNFSFRNNTPRLQKSQKIEKWCFKNAFVAAGICDPPTTPFLRYHHITYFFCFFFKRVYFAFILRFHKRTKFWTKANLRALLLCNKF